MNNLEWFKHNIGKPVMISGYDLIVTEERAFVYHGREHNSLIFERFTKQGRCLIRDTVTNNTMSFPMYSVEFILQEEEKSNDL